MFSQKLTVTFYEHWFVHVFYLDNIHQSVFFSDSFPQNVFYVTVRLSCRNDSMWVNVQHWIIFVKNKFFHTKLFLSSNVRLLWSEEAVWPLFDIEIMCSLLILPRVLFVSYLLSNIDASDIITINLLLMSKQS